jgi:Ca2+-binding RTX toxin-like protein
MGARSAVVAVVAGLAFAAPAAAQQGVPYAPWDGSNPFNCTLHDAGTGPAPMVPDDPFCVEFDKNSQSLLPNAGIVDFFANEPGRVAQAAPKCFYYQSDHWTGAAVQGVPPELWHWDGQYFFDKALGVGGVNLQNFRVGGQSFDPSGYGVPTAFYPYMDQGGGGAYVTQGIPVDPVCGAMVDTQAERDQVYRGGIPPPVPPATYDGNAACASENTVMGSSAPDELIGGEGGDVLIGLAGNDKLVGAGSADCLFGQRGADRLRGGRGADQLSGGGGKDRVKGGKGRDTITAGRGPDTINAADGKRDTIDCGGGKDVVRADPEDRLTGCEKSERKRRR